MLIYCNARSHEGNDVPIRRFGVGRRDHGSWRFHGNDDQVLEGVDLLTEDERRRRRGTSRHAPGDLSRADFERRRWSLECPQCGLKVDMTRETAARLIEGLAEAGRFDASLGALAATL